MVVPSQNANNIICLVNGYSAFIKLLEKQITIDIIGQSAGLKEVSFTVKNDKVDLVKYGEGSVEELVKIFDMVTKIMFIVVVALILITAFLIGNTIKITIQSRKREIEIRRLVGASNLFIKQPFFFEGIILGFFGSIIPVGVICFGYTFLYDKLGGQLFTAIVKLVKPNEIIYITSIVVVVLGIVVGAFGSSGAVRKHLKI